MKEQRILTPAPKLAPRASQMLGLGRQWLIHAALSINAIAASGKCQAARLVGWRTPAGGGGTADPASIVC